MKFASKKARKDSLRDILPCKWYDIHEVIIMRDIGKNIKELRMQKNMTQDELAAHLFVTRQTVSNYETGKSRPDVEMLIKIAEVLKIDMQQLIYGLQSTEADRQRKRMSIGAGFTAVLLIIFLLIRPIAEAWQNDYFISLKLLNHAVILLLTLICAGWTGAQLIGMALQRRPLTFLWVRHVRITLAVLLAVFLGLNTLCYGSAVLNDLLYAWELRGEWVEHEITNTVTGSTYITSSYQQLPVPLPQWLLQFTGGCLFAVYHHLWIFSLAGAALWVLDFPKKKGQHEIN